MANLQQQLSPNFRLSELLYSDSAQRHPELLRKQHNPPESVVSNLAYLCSTTLQPLRDDLRWPIQISSGYRCKPLNDLVGSNDNSQHLLGQAADCQLSEGFLHSPRTEPIRHRIEQHIQALTGEEVRAEVNANFYLFAYVCLRRNHFDIDQVIHEYGQGYGQPAWVHIAASPSKRDRRQILTLGNYAQSPTLKYPELATALRFGTGSFAS